MLLSSLIAFLSFSASITFQAIASPSLSGSVARYMSDVLLASFANSFTYFSALSIISYFMAKSLSGSTEPFFTGRSLTWPKDAATLNSLLKYLPIVFAFAGDSTINNAILLIILVFKDNML